MELSLVREKVGRVERCFRGKMKTMLLQVQAEEFYSPTLERMSALGSLNQKGFLIFAFKKAKFCFVFSVCHFNPLCESSRLCILL